MSADRLSTYRRLANGDIEIALRLYVWNTALSESLYGPLQGFEVILRNAIAQTLSAGFGDDWYRGVPRGPLEYLKITEARQQLATRGTRVSTSSLVALLGLGFWVAVFDRHYENILWRTHLRYAFPHGPDPLRRNEVFSIVDRLRRLRNRIAHHEQIITSPLVEECDMLLEFVAWICPDTSGWIRYHSRFTDVWNQRP